MVFCDAMNMGIFSIGTTNLRVSPIGLGTWPLGGPNTIDGTAVGWKMVTDDTAIETIQAALYSGITLFDTADIYGRGRAEELLGRSIPRSRTDVIIATKGGLLPEMVGSNPSEIRRCFFNVKSTSIYTRLNRTARSAVTGCFHTCRRK